MHPHLHTKTNRQCEDVMKILEECHERGFIHKVFGNCNKAKRDVNMCLRAARIERTDRNREAAKIKRAQVEEKWKEIEQNS